MPRDSSSHLLIKLLIRQKNEYDDLLIEKGVLSKLCLIVPAAVAYFMTTLVYGLVPAGVSQVVLNVSNATFVVAFILSISAGLAVIQEIWIRKDKHQRFPIRGYLQVARLILFIVGFILTLSLLLDKDPTLLIAGLGGMTAVILLIFKDTILSLVASVQLTTNNMVKIGDWIEMPKYGADGDVIEIALHTVKIQNWDKTITTIPTYKLIQDSFKNWRGMSESGGRRIKRSLSLDMQSIRFLEADELENFRKYSVLEEYIGQKLEDINADNENRSGDKTLNANIRRLTNIGTLRAYIIGYLKANPAIHQEGMTFLIRQLAPSSEGLPLEIYVFSNNINWVAYEGIQADIFDHLLAILPEFGLRAYQQPSGADFANLINK